MSAKIHATVIFAKKRETKGTWLFDEQVGSGQVEVIGTLYVKKHALQAWGWPLSFTLTISSDDSVPQS